MLGVDEQGVLVRDGVQFAFLGRGLCQNVHSVTPADFIFYYSVLGILMSYRQLGS